MLNGQITGHITGHAAGQTAGHAAGQVAGFITGQTGFIMTAWMDAAPFVPNEKSCTEAGLFELANKLNRLAAQVTGQLAPETAETLRQHMAVINSYYSNLIEGNRTLPHQIREAQKGNFEQDPIARDKQLESLAHIEVQAWIRSQPRDLNEVMSVQFIKELHRRFYMDLPADLKTLTDDSGDKVSVVGGQFRDRGVKVGHHVPPGAENLEQLVGQFCDEYRSARYPGDKRLIAIAAAHHRLLWIHAFLDGNGRVVRLWTDAALRAAGLESVGVWCLSRGLAIYSERYKENLAQADMPQQGQTDGRGPLSEKGLTRFCKFVLESAVDQVEYVSGLLDLQSMKRRIEDYVNFRADLKPAAKWVLYQAFIQGSLSRSDALALTGEKEDRTARRLLKKLRDEGLLIEDGPDHRSPLKWAVPEHAERHFFPNLSPQ